MAKRNQGKTQEIVPAEISRYEWIALKQAAEPYCDCCGCGNGRVQTYRPEQMAKLVELGFAMREVSADPREGRLTNAGRAFVEMNLEKVAAR